MGWKYIARARATLAGAAAMRWALQDNRTAELAEWDAAELERQTDELAAELDDFDLGDMGFEEGQLEALLDGNAEKAHGFAPKPPAKDPPAGEQEYPSVFTIILTCRDESHQAELIQEFDRRGYEFTAPNVS